MRHLEQQQAKDSKDGVIIELSHRLNDSIEAAFGYKFAGFNDDLGALDYSTEGIYFRLTAALD